MRVPVPPLPPELEVPATRPINEEQTRALLHWAVEQSRTSFPGDVTHLDAFLGAVNRRWASDWVTSFMGGGGGGGHYVEDGSLYLVLSDRPFSKWDARVAWQDGAWIVAEWKDSELATDEEDADLVEAYMLCLYFDDPNAYQWERDPAGGYRRRGAR